jgi:alcohol dehydrogenase (cytochrome c)
MNTRVLGLALLAGFLWPRISWGQVSFDRILRADQEAQNWLTYSGTTFSQRHSLLRQITPANVKNLELQWIYQAQSLEKFEATALVVDGIMYTVQAPNGVIALDAATGRVFWIYTYVPAPWAKPCCGYVNRGLAILGDTLFMATIDAHLIAIDAKSGRPIWNTTVADAKSGYVLTLAPLVVKDKVIVGTAGGDYGIRGFIVAYDIHTGKEAWRFYTIPAPGDPGGSTWEGNSWQSGGGSVWVTGSYDPSLNLSYWGTGNPSPDYNGDPRPGDNLFTDSVVALDPDTGQLKWYYQFTPHEEFDWDSAQVPVLTDLEWREKDGHKKLRKVMLWANRNGLFYVLDRTKGQFLLGRPFVEVNWMKGFDEEGRPIPVPGKTPSSKGTVIYPGNRGGTSWYSPSYSPRTGLFYISTWANYSSVFFKFPVKYGEELGGGFKSLIPDDRVLPQHFRKDEEGYGAVRAIDPKTGEKKWEFKMADVTDAGILTTASDLLFSGGRDGYFFALDARDGALLWKTSLGAAVISGPMTYSVGGKQYVAVNAGNCLFTFALRQ